MGQSGSYFDRFSPNWGLPFGQVSRFQLLQFGLHDAFYGRIIIIIIIIIKISTITIGFQHFVLEPLIRRDVLDSYSATYCPIFTKLGMLLHHAMAHLLIDFFEVWGFPLGCVGFWVFFCPAPFLNDPVTARQMQKFHFFSIIIDLETPENCARLVWFRLGQKPRTSSQK